jgi:hypothetical protein
MQENLPSLDVILPFHVYDKRLYAAIESVSKSKFVNLRCILVDDSGENNSQKIQELIAFVRVATKNNSSIILKTVGKLGYASAINYASNEIFSEYVSLMNSDDRVSKYKFSKQINKLITTNSDVCLGSIRKRKFFIPVPSLLIRLKNRTQYSPNLLLFGAYGADAGILVKKEIWKKYFKFPTGTMAADWSLAFLVYPKLKLTFEPNAKYYYSVHSGQTTRKKTYEDFFKSIYPDWTKFNNILDLPELSLEEASIIAAPSSKVKIDLVDISKILNWSLEFTSKYGTSFTKHLIERRLNLYSLRYYKKPRRSIDSLKLIPQLMFRLILSLLQR